MIRYIIELRMYHLSLGKLVNLISFCYNSAKINIFYADRSLTATEFKGFSTSTKKDSQINLKLTYFIEE